MITKEREKISVTNFVGETNNFSIANSGKAFRTLIDTLYENKILAVVREIMSNAFDAHIEASKGDVPFVVQLPSNMDSEFYVRDFGNSMSHNIVMKLYSTIFHSTKEDTNTQVGMFGLGSKSPFAYTDNFTVTTYVNSEERVYSCFLDGDGVPTITHVSTKATDEPSGTKVSLSIRTLDYDAFVQAYISCVLPYKVRPKILGRDIKVPDPYLSVDCVDFYKADDLAMWNGMKQYYLSQGSVLYTLTDTEILGVYDKLFNIKSGGYNNNNARVHSPTHDINLLPIINVPIGTFDITPSREGISYTPDTKASLKEFAKEVGDRVQALAAEEYKDCKTRTDAVIKVSGVYDMFKEEYSLLTYQNAFNLKLTNKVIRFPTDWELACLKGAGKNLPAMSYGRTVGPELNVAYSLGLEKIGDMEPGYLYVADGNKYRKVYSVSLGEITDCFYVTGLERREFFKHERFRMLSKRAYFMHTQDLPRFQRLLNIHSKDIISVENLPEIKPATTLASGTPAAKTLKQRQDIKTASDNSYYIEVFRGKIVSTAHFNYYYYDPTNFIKSLVQFCVEYDKTFPGLDLEKKFAEIKPLPLTKGMISKAGWEKDRSLGAWFESQIDLSQYDEWIKYRQRQSVLNNWQLWGKINTHLQKKFKGTDIGDIIVSEALAKLANKIIREKLVLQEPSVKPPHQNTNWPSTLSVYKPLLILSAKHNVGTSAEEVEEVFKEVLTLLEEYAIFDVKNYEELDKLLKGKKK